MLAKIQRNTASSLKKVLDVLSGMFKICKLQLDLLRSATQYLRNYRNHFLESLLYLNKRRSSNSPFTSSSTWSGGFRYALRSI